MNWRLHSLSAVLCLGLFQIPGNAIILYSGDNTANTTAPDASRQDAFSSVGRIAGAARGSVVHLRGKYLLTAQHVNTNTNLVSFDGITNWPIDTTFSAVQIGPADMKLIKLIDDPGLPETPLFEGIVSETGSSVTLTGWGVGRNTSVDDSGSGLTNVWAWGSTETMTKRWGTNQIDLVANGNIAGYTYDYLRTDLDSFTGNDEAAITLYDSGSGLFIEDAGIWKLAGIATAVSTANSSTFSLSGDANFFVRIASYATQIEAEIPDTMTYSGWQIDHGLYGSDALDGADTDGDGIRQLEEFAYGGDPNEKDVTVLPSSALINDNGSKYLELSIRRPIGIQGISYTPQTTTDLNNWPNDSTGIFDTDPTPVDNGDGTETLTYRRADAATASSTAFIRIVIAKTP